MQDATDATLTFVWSADRCTRRFDPEWHTHYVVEDLGKVKRAGFSLERVVMVDDTPQKLERHYGNHIRVAEFVGEESDDELARLLPFLRWLSAITNMRSVEKRHWRNFKASD